LFVKYIFASINQLRLNWFKLAPTFTVYYLLIFECTQTSHKCRGSDLDLQTFKLVDQLSGRMLGLRADMTPQAARIDAHLLNRKGIARLCYAGSVVHTLPPGGNRLRESLQVGAELFGHRGLESDLEVLQLMLQALAQAGVATPQVDLGHVGVLRALIELAALDARREEALFEALQAKDLPELRTLLRGVRQPWREALLSLPQLYGDASVLREAGRRLPALAPIRAGLRGLARLAEAVGNAHSTLRYDLGELRGYRYHSGVVFAAYAPGFSAAIARGGRYDQIGQAFGRSRPATGFSMDLRELAAVATEPQRRRILAPQEGDAALERLVRALRKRGEVVVRDLPGHAATRHELACDHVVELVHAGWRVRRLTASPPARRRRGFLPRQLDTGAATAGPRRGVAKRGRS
jgi:ATP phosphoribosyltransferase regulatory subunit